MAKNQEKTGFVVRPAGRNSRCGFQEAHVETQLAHTNRLDVHKCIPELRKIGYQRRGKYDFLPADTLCQKKASPNTHFIIQRLCHVGGKSLPTFFFVCFFLTRWLENSQILLTALRLASQNTKVHSQKHGVLPGEDVAGPHTVFCFPILVFGLTTPEGWMLPNT